MLRRHPMYAVPGRKQGVSFLSFRLRLRSRIVRMVSAVYEGRAQAFGLSGGRIF